MNYEPFSFEKINLGCRTLNRGNSTVAYITPQGYVDWLQPGPGHRSPLMRSVRKETHLCYVLGTKFNLHFCGLTEPMDEFEFQAEEDYAVISARSHSPDRRFSAKHRAIIVLNPKTRLYEWTQEATLRCEAADPVELNWLEYTNVYPTGTGRCMLFEPDKRFRHTLLVDSAGVVWDFPHQHTMHYTRKINPLTFAVGTLGGFFLEDLNPCVAVLESALMPDWAICDMYYDLHCGMRTSGPMAPGQELRVKARIHYLGYDEGKKLLDKAQSLPYTAEDYRTHFAPRLALGKNAILDPVCIDGYEDASCFRQNPPVCVWDRTTGPKDKGSLRISNPEAKETVWSAVPPTQIPNQKKLNISGIIKTEGVEGKGMFIRIRYHTFVWHPEPHVEWVRTLESRPVSGTRDWTRVTVPELEVPEEEFDYLVWFDVVLDGKGTGWLSDIDIDLLPILEPAPEPVGPRV